MSTRANGMERKARLKEQIPQQHKTRYNHAPTGLGTSPSRRASTKKGDGVSTGYQGMSFARASTGRSPERTRQGNDTLHVTHEGIEQSLGTSKSSPHRIASLHQAKKKITLSGTDQAASNSSKSHVTAHAHLSVASRRSSAPTTRIQRAVSEDESELNTLVARINPNSKLLPISSPRRGSLAHKGKAKPKDVSPQQRLPPSIVPKDQYIVETSPMPPKEVERYTTEYREDDELWHTTIFPAQKPTDRRDVQILSDWLNQQLDELASSKQKGQAYMHEAQQLYSIAFQEIMRQVHAHCAERGELLALIWQKNMEVFKRFVSLVIQEREEVKAQIEEDSEREHRLKRKKLIRIMKHVEGEVSMEKMNMAAQMEGVQNELQEHKERIAELERTNAHIKSLNERLEDSIHNERMQHKTAQERMRKSKKQRDKEMALLRHQLETQMLKLQRVRQQMAKYRSIAKQLTGSLDLEKDGVVLSQLAGLTSEPSVLSTAGSYDDTELDAQLQRVHAHALLQQEQEQQQQQMMQQGSVIQAGDFVLVRDDDEDDEAEARRARVNYWSSDDSDDEVRLLDGDRGHQDEVWTTDDEYNSMEDSSDDEWEQDEDGQWLRRPSAMTVQTSDVAAGDDDAGESEGREQQGENDEDEEEEKAEGDGNEQGLAGESPSTGTRTMKASSSQRRRQAQKDDGNNEDEDVSHQQTVLAQIHELLQELPSRVSDEVEIFRKALVSTVLETQVYAPKAERMEKVLEVLEARKATKEAEERDRRRAERRRNRRNSVRYASTQSQAALPSTLSTLSSTGSVSSGTSPPRTRRLSVASSTGSSAVFATVPEEQQQQPREDGQGAMSSTGTGTGEEEDDDEVKALFSNDYTPIAYHAHTKRLFSYRDLVDMVDAGVQTEVLFVKEANKTLGVAPRVLGSSTFYQKYFPHSADAQEAIKEQWGEFLQDHKPKTTDNQSKRKGKRKDKRLANAEEHHQNRSSSDSLAGRGAGGGHRGHRRLRKRNLHLPFKLRKLLTTVRTDKTGNVDGKVKPQKRVARLVQTLFAEKHAQDEINDREHIHRSALFVFTHDHLTQRYGLRRLAERHLVDLLISVLYYKDRDAAIRMFGRFVFYPDEYDLACLNFYLSAMAYTKSLLGLSMSDVDDHGGPIMITVPMGLEVLSHTMPFLMQDEPKVVQAFTSTLQNLVDFEEARLYADDLYEALVELWRSLRTEDTHLIQALFDACDRDLDDLLDLADFQLLCSQASELRDKEVIAEYTHITGTDHLHVKVSFEQFVGASAIDVFMFKPFPESLSNYTDQQLARLLHTSWEDSTFKMNGVMQNMLAELPHEDYQILLERREKVKHMMEGESVSAMWYSFRLFMADLGNRLMSVYKLNSLNAAFQGNGLHELGRLC